LFCCRAIVGETGKVNRSWFLLMPCSLKQLKIQKDWAFSNVNLFKGDIERYCLFAIMNSNVIISNCVLNLVPDNKQSLCQMMRVFKSNVILCLWCVIKYQVQYTIRYNYVEFIIAKRHIFNVSLINSTFVKPNLFWIFKLL